MGDMAMRMRYYELVGRCIVTADGVNVGRITDLLAHAEGEELVVNALLVGPSGLLRRIGSRQVGNLRIAPARRIPWAWVARIADAVHLSVPAAELSKARTERPEGETAVGAAGRGMRR
jgi:sporulation protein YlmC with PRC-barrel domain